MSKLLCLFKYLYIFWLVFNFPSLFFLLKQRILSTLLYFISTLYIRFGNIFKGVLASLFSLLHWSGHFPLLFNDLFLLQKQYSLKVTLLHKNKIIKEFFKFFISLCSSLYFQNPFMGTLLSLHLIFSRVEAYALLRV